MSVVRRQQALSLFMDAAVISVINSDLCEFVGTELERKRVLCYNSNIRTKNGRHRKWLEIKVTLLSI